MTTPNTTGPSAELQRYDLSMDGHIEPNEGGDYVLRDSALAALSRAREEARREALEEAAQRCRELAQAALDEREREAAFQTETGYSNRPFLASLTDQSQAFMEALSEIRALLTPTSQGETKEQRGFAGIPFVVDPAVPPGEAQFVDPVDGRVIGRITGAAGGMEQP